MPADESTSRARGNERRVSEGASASVAMLQVDGLDVSHGEIRVKGVGLKADRAGIMTVLGSNGAGKVIIIEAIE